MKRVKQFEEHFDRKELVDNIYESLKDYQTREEIEEFVGEGYEKCQISNSFLKLKYLFFFFE